MGFVDEYELDVGIFWYTGRSGKDGALLRVGVVELVIDGLVSGVVDWIIRVIVAGIFNGIVCNSIGEIVACIIEVPM